MYGEEAEVRGQGQLRFPRQDRGTGHSRYAVQTRQKLTDLRSPQEPGRQHVLAVVGEVVPANFQKYLPRQTAHVGRR